MTPGMLKLKIIEDDPTDDKFFVAAVEGGAKYIVSGDNKLKEIREYRGVKILTPTEFLKRLKQKK